MTATKDKAKKKSYKNNEVTCFRCKKTRHYLNEFEEELPKTSGNKQGMNLPISNNDRSDGDSR